nr:hypothetical protein [uncultured Fluviicola sp.]
MKVHTTNYINTFITVSDDCPIGNGTVPPLKGFDFLVMGILLLGTGSVCELVLRTVEKRTNRLILCLAALGVFILVWMELAVGIFGTPFAGS